MRKTGEKIKEAVRKRYTEAIEAAPSNDRGCCGKNCCGGTATLERGLLEGRVVTGAGYGQDELQSIPTDAIENSFGCGNPLAFAEISKGQLVVDIGSGAGIDCLLAARKVGSTGRVIGIDMTPVMIEKARENARRGGVDNVEFRIGDAESMPVGDGAADWVISNCVINLSPDKPQVFREAFRVLKPGGRLSITDIMVEALPWVLRKSANLYTSCVAGAISEKQYLQGLQDAGFSDVKVTERIVYDRGQILALIRETRPFGRLTSLLKRPLFAWADRTVVGKVWSAKVTARKS